jgi:hypothetical protein
VLQQEATCGSFAAIRNRVVRNHPRNVVGKQS